MAFLHTILGVHFEGDTREPDKRCIGEVVCPECQIVIARLYQEPEYVGFHAWLPGENPSAPGTKTAGWELYAKIYPADDPADDEGCGLLCWNRHGAFWVDARDCRGMAAKYQRKARKVRLAARPASDEVLQL